MKLVLALITSLGVATAFASQAPAAPAAPAKKEEIKLPAKKDAAQPAKSASAPAKADKKAEAPKK